MPLTRLVADAFGVVTICLVSLLVLLGFLCVLYSIYFRSCIRRQGFIQLGYFNRPWIIRITLVLYAIWWGFGEVVRLSLLRRGDRVLHVLSLKWQETLCKIYVLSNLGIAEPCLFLTIVFLVRASLQKRESGTSSQQWNGKMAGYVLLSCLPYFIFQCIVVLTGPKINKEKSYGWKKIPHYFTSTATSSKIEDDYDIAFCTYPLLSTILLGLFATLLTGYLLLLGRRMLSSVINKGLRRRAFILICTVSGLFPLRVILLGLSVLSLPEHILFEALVFSAFLVLLACAGLGICMLVYCPIADSLALRRGLGDLEIGRRRRSLDDQNDTASLIANQILLEGSSATSLGRNSDASTKRGSISFRTMLKDETPNAEVFEEVSLYSPDTAHRRQIESPPASPPAPGQPMRPLRQIS